MKVVVNGQSSIAHNINDGVPRGSLLGPTRSLLYINDLPNNLLQCLGNTDDTTVYKNLDDENLAADLMSVLTVVNMRRSDHQNHHQP